jgi:hypothetical protein
MSAEQYYALKVRPIYRSYPAYAKGHEPAGYLEWLKQREPEIIFDASKLHTKEDWIRAGKDVFEAESRFVSAPAQPSADEVPYPLPSTGVLPYFLPGYRYIIRKKGVLEVGINSCAGCHTRIMPDGSFIEGAQGNFDHSVPPARLRAIRDMPSDAYRLRVETAWINFGVPWLTSRKAFEEALTREELAHQAASAHRAYSRGKARVRPILRTFLRSSASKATSILM